MLLITGKVESIQEREAGTPGNTWIERTIVVRDWGHTLYVTAGRELVDSGLPAEGDSVALEVAVRPYVNKRTNEPGHGFTAFRRNADAESKLFGAAGLRAAG